MVDRQSIATRCRKVIAIRVSNRCRLRRQLLLNAEEIGLLNWLSLINNKHTSQVFFFSGFYHSDHRHHRHLIIFILVLWVRSCHQSCRKKRRMRWRRGSLSILIFSSFFILFSAQWACSSFSRRSLLCLLASIAWIFHHAHISMHIVQRRRLNISLTKQNRQFYSVFHLPRFMANSWLINTNPAMETTLRLRYWVAENSAQKMANLESAKKHVKRSSKHKLN